MSGGTPKKWRFLYAGEVYDERALTLEEAEEIEDALGMSWLQINPGFSAKQARGVLAVLHSKRTGTPVAEVRADLGKIPVSEFIVNVLEYVDEDIASEFTDGFPQVAAADRSTPTSSSSAEDPGTGLPA